MAFLLLTLSLVAQNAGQDAESQIRMRIDRLEQSLQEKPIASSDFPNFKENSGELIRSAREAVSNHRVFQSLEKLAQLLSFVQGGRRGTEDLATGDSGLPAFEAKWAKANLEVTAVDQQIRTRNWKNTPEALRALIENALGKVVPLMAGSRGFALSTSPADGMFYLGQAEGLGEFVKFCASLNLPRTGKAIPERSVLPELQRLQDKVNAAFVPPKSIDQHPRFIALNATLKTALELDAGKFYAGALYQYLDAVRVFGTLETAELDAEQKSQLKDKIAAMRATLHVSTDDSILEIFAERAESLVSSAKTPEELRSAFLISSQVVPAYMAAREPAAMTKRTSRKTIQVTLVRWPYT
jgi:hypothetical protein